MFGEGESATVFGIPKIMSFSVEGKNFFSSLGFEFKIKQNLEKSNTQRQSKAVQKLSSHTNKQDGE